MMQDSLLVLLFVAIVLVCVWWVIKLISSDRGSDTEIEEYYDHIQQDMDCTKNQRHQPPKRLE